MNISFKTIIGLDTPQFLIEFPNLFDAYDWLSDLKKWEPTNTCYKIISNKLTKTNCNANNKCCVFLDINEFMLLTKYLWAGLVYAGGYCGELTDDYCEIMKEIKDK